MHHAQSRAESPPLLELVVEDGPERGRRYDAHAAGRVLIGRAAEAQLCLPGDGRASRLHCVLHLRPPLLYLEDLSSRNGTFVNDGAATVHACVLRAGDRVRVGNSVIRVAELRTAAALAAATLPLGSADLLGLDERPYCPICSEATRLLGTPVAPHCCESCQERLLADPPLPPDFGHAELLGRGSMGAVFRVRHLRLGTPRALKIILPRVAMSIENQRRFLREARGQARLNHPNVVQVYDLFELTPGVFGLLMEFVPGESAAALLNRWCPLPPELVVALGDQALTALAYSHRLGVVHRDIKDENLLLTPRPDGGMTLKLADFGLARDLAESGASDLTQSGMVAGTPPYMAPEQVLDFHGAPPAVDLYALAATLYRLLCGDYPRDYPPGVHWMIVNLEHPVVALRHRNPAVPERLAQVLERALARDPAARYPDAAALRAALLASL